MLADGSKIVDLHEVAPLCRHATLAGLPTAQQLSCLAPQLDNTLPSWTVHTGFSARTIIGQQDAFGPRQAHNTHASPAKAEPGLPLRLKFAFG